MSLTKDEMREIPKVELHYHLEGSVRASTAVDLMRSAGKAGPEESDEQVLSRCICARQVSCLKECLDRFATIQELLSTPEVLERITFECCEDAWNEGTRVLEIRYSPSFIQTGHEGFTLDAIHGGVVAGLRRAEAQFPELCVGLIGIIDRCVSVEEGDREMDFILSHAEDFCAVDLANDERGFKETGPSYARMFEKARAAGLRVTVHSGEEDVPEAAEMVRMSVEILGADRIGHGIHVLKDPAVVALLREKGIPLEVSVTSNWVTNGVRSTAEHPIRALIDAGLDVTINTDDKGIFNIDLLHEYDLLQREHGFTAEMFAHANRIAFRRSFVKSKSRWADTFGVDEDSN